MGAKEESRDGDMDQERRGSGVESRASFDGLSGWADSDWLLCVQNFKTKQNSPLGPCFVISAPQPPAC